MRGSVLATALALSLLTSLWAGCSGSQGSAPRTAEGEGGATGSEAGGGEAEPGAEPVQEQPAACVSYGNDEVDPLQRWIRAFPIERGGAVLSFVGSEAAQMDVEAALEMAAIEGYEDVVCGTAVVVWVPGLECEGRERELARRVEDGTTMTAAETTCFRIDEVRLRIADECSRGTLPADRCR